METLKTLLSQLKFRHAHQTLESLLASHPAAREAIINTLEALCQEQLNYKNQCSVAYRIEQARFGQIQTVDTFDFKYNDSTLKIKSRYLKLYTPKLTEQGLCVLLVSSSGLGKTHLARALGYFLCQQTQRVRFTTLSAMALELTTADSCGTLKKAILPFIQPALLILDEVGYTNLRELESNLVFQIISQRYEHKRSTVITTNRPFGEWNQIFHNDAMAHALLDRLVERSEVFHLEGPSYREAHRQQLKP